MSIFGRRNGEELILGRIIIINQYIMIKTTYISPVTRIVEMIDFESAILYSSFVTKNVYVDQWKNIDGNEEYFGKESDKQWFEF